MTRRGGNKQKRKASKSVGRSAGKSRTTAQFTWNVPLPGNWETAGDTHEKGMLERLKDLAGNDGWYNLDRSQTIISFWMSSLEAAEKGEVIRLEEYLEKVIDWSDEGDIWPAHREDEDVGWGQLEDGWSQWSANKNESDHGWGRDAIRLWNGSIKRWRSQDDDSNELGDEGNQKIDEGYRFVEDIARRNSVGEGRRKEMHRFFEMSTDEKIEKIKEIVHVLRSD